MNTQRILCLTPRCPKLFQMCLTMSAPSLRTPACRFGYSVLLQLWLAQIECSTLFEKSAAASKLQWNTNMINIKHTCSSYAFEILWMLFARRNSGSEPAGSIDHPAGRIAYQHCFPTGSKHVGVVWHYFFLKKQPKNLNKDPSYPMLLFRESRWMVFCFHQSLRWTFKRIDCESWGRRCTGSEASWSFLLWLRVWTDVRLIVGQFGWGPEHVEGLWHYMTLWFWYILILYDTTWYCVMLYHTKWY